MLARRLDRAALLRRVFGDEVTHLGLTSDDVPVASARAPPDHPVSELELGA
jgi:hypothetical protein